MSYDISLGVCSQVNALPGVWYNDASTLAVRDTPVNNLHRHGLGLVKACCGAIQGLPIAIPEAAIDTGDFVALPTRKVRTCHRLTCPNLVIDLLLEQTVLVGADRISTDILPWWQRGMPFAMHAKRAFWPALLPVAPGNGTDPYCRCSSPGTAPRARNAPSMTAVLLLAQFIACVPPYVPTEHLSSSPEEQYSAAVLTHMQGSLPGHQAMLHSRWECSGHNGSCLVCCRHRRWPCKQQARAQVVSMAAVQYTPLHRFRRRLKPPYLPVIHSPSACTRHTRSSLATRASKKAWRSIVAWYARVRA